MILNGINSDDKLYLRVKSDIDSNLEKGKILRYDTKWLEKNIWTREAAHFIDNYFIKFLDKIDQKDDSDDKRELLYTYYRYCDDFKIKRYAIVKEDFQLPLELDKNDVLFLNDYLKNKIFSNELASLSFSLPSDPIFYRHNIKEWNTQILKHFEQIEKSDESQTLVPLNNENQILRCTKDNIRSMAIPFYKGEIIDFRNPIMWYIFFKQDYMRLFINTEVLETEEMLPLFIKDYENWIEKANGQYFKLDDRIKITNWSWSNLLKITEIIPNFHMDLVSLNVPYEKDNNGFIRYFFVNDNFKAQQEFLKIGKPVTKELGTKLYEKRLLREKQAKELYETILFAQKHKSSYKKMKNKSPDLTPLEFMKKYLEQEQKNKKILVKKLTNILNNKINSM